MVMDPPASLVWTRRPVVIMVREGKRQIFSWFRSHPQQRQQDELVDGEQRDLEHGHGQQLDRTGFTQNCSEGNEDGTGAEVSVDHTEKEREMKISARRG